MSDKLKEKELLECFDDMCIFLAIHHWTKRDERAVAIREMIQGHAEQEEIEVRYIEIILDLYDRLEQKKPEVTEEWIEEKAREMAHTNFLGATDVYIVKAKDFIRSLIEGVWDRGSENSKD